MDSICEQNVRCKEVLAHLRLEEGLISREVVMTVMNLAMVFRLIIAAQATALLPQALLAGLGLSGSEAALDAHMSFGGAILVVSAAQVTVALLLRRSVGVSRWPVVASIGLSVADAVQMITGRLQLFALHLPVGVALFGASIGLAIYAWARRPVQIAKLSGARAGEITLSGRPIGEKP
jgi:hypothetical protein